MTEDEYVLEFTPSGINVKTIENAPLSGETTEKLVEQYDWGSVPADRIDLSITSLEPKFEADDRSALAKVRLTADRLETDGSESAEEGSTHPGEFWERVENALGISYQGQRIRLNGDTTAKANLVSFVRFLLSEGHLSRADLPVESGWKRHLINTEPVHQNGETMESPESIGEDVYVETKYSRDHIRTKIRELGEEFGESKTSSTDGGTDHEASNVTFRCPIEGCAYEDDTRGSVKAHVSSSTDELHDGELGWNYDPQRV